jgi:hypothetical protein
MPAVLKNTECSGCNRRHHFSLPTDELQVGRRYDYVCPETGNTATLRPSSAGEVARCAPQGAVMLTPADDQVEGD